jgi:hypothetical protein
MAACVLPGSADKWQLCAFWLLQEAINLSPEQKQHVVRNRRQLLLSMEQASVASSSPPC